MSFIIHKPTQSSFQWDVREMLMIKLGYEDEIIPDYQGGPDIIIMILIRETKEAQSQLEM